MAYTIRHRRSDGDVNVERVIDGLRREVIAKTVNDVLGQPPAYIREDHKAVARRDGETNGFTPGKVFRRVARIPAAAWREFKAQGGNVKDRRALRRFIRDGGYNTVRGDSF